MCYQIIEYDNKIRVYVNYGGKDVEIMTLFDFVQMIKERYEK